VELQAQVEQVVLQEHQALQEHQELVEVKEEQRDCSIHLMIHLQMIYH
jgi:hypothetical protein